MARLAAVYSCLVMAVAGYLSFENAYKAEASTVFVHNQCSYEVCAKYWVPNSAVGGACSAQGSGGTWSVPVSASWQSGVFWAIANSDCSGQACNTGPPAGVTLFEITVAGGGGNDYYDLSSISGYNIPMTVVPTNGNCPSADCRGQDAASCPTGFYPGGPDQTKACATGSSDYNVYLCP